MEGADDRRAQGRFPRLGAQPAPRRSRNEPRRVNDLSGDLLHDVRRHDRLHGVGQPRSVARRNHRLDLHRVHHRDGGGAGPQLGDLVARGLRHPWVPAGVVPNLLRGQADQHPRLHHRVDDRGGVGPDHRHGRPVRRARRAGVDARHLRHIDGDDAGDCARVCVGAASGWPRRH